MLQGERRLVLQQNLQTTEIESMDEEDTAFGGTTQQVWSSPSSTEGAAGGSGSGGGGKSGGSDTQHPGLQQGFRMRTSCAGGGVCCSRSRRGTLGDRQEQEQEVLLCWAPWKTMLTRTHSPHSGSGSTHFAMDTSKNHVQQPRTELKEQMEEKKKKRRTWYLVGSAGHNPFVR
jgi:hypothetical protein